MRTNLEHSNLLSPRVQGLRLNQVTITLTGSFTVPTDGPTVWLMNGGASDRNVTLPALLYEKQLVISNLGATNDLDILDAGGISLVSLGAQSMGMFFAGASAWTWLTGSLASTTFQRRTVVATDDVETTDMVVEVDHVAAVVLSLPASGNWRTAAGIHVPFLTIMDISGAAQTNNVTINPNGAETISGAASQTMDSDWGVLRLAPADGGGWVIV